MATKVTRNLKNFSNYSFICIPFGGLFKPIFGLSDKIGLLVPLEAVQACCYIEKKKVKSPSKNGRVIKWLG